MSDVPQKILNAFVEADGRTVVLVYRKPGNDEVYGRRIRGDLSIYLDSSQVNAETARQLRNSSHVASYDVEGKWIRVGWKNEFVRRSICHPTQSPLAQQGIAVYEGDVSAVDRYCVDHDVQIDKPRRVFLDIETDSRVPFSKKEHARVLCWALVDQHKKLIATGMLERDEDVDEKRVLAELWSALRAYDQVLAWNGDRFDFPVICARSRMLGIAVDARRWLFLDHLAVFKRMNQQTAESGEEKTSMKLQDVAQSVVGHGKDNFDATKTYEEWAAGGERRARLLTYNVQDTLLLPEIDEETGFIDTFQVICEVCGVFPRTSSLQPTIQLDAFMLRLGKARGYRFGTRVYREAGAQFAGAFVMEPKTRGVVRDVHVLDFKSLYPSVMITWNMSPDTKRPVPLNGPIPSNCCRSPSTGVGFTTDFEGILTYALKELLSKRKKFKDLKTSFPPGTPEWHQADRTSNAYKVAANSFYGAIGSLHSRFYDRTIAESVTQNAVWLIKQVASQAEARGWSVEYGDTDSVFVRGCTREEFDAFKTWCNKEFFPGLIAAQGCKSNEISISYEKQFDRLVIVTKKRYCASYVHYEGKQATADSKPEIKGLEYKRGDSAKLARELQAEVVDLLVGGLKINKDGPVPCDDLERYHLVLSRMRQRVLESELGIDEVRVSKSLSKGIREYARKFKADGQEASQGPHVEVAKILQSRGREVGQGTRIEYVVVDGSVSPAKVIPAEDYDGNCDRFDLWESLVFPPTQRLLEAAFPTHDWASWARVRPAKVRVKKQAGEGQMSLAITPTNARALAPAQRSTAPIVLEIREESSVDVAKIKEEAKRFPGARPLRLRIILRSGALAELETSLTCSGSARMIEALAAIGIECTAA